MVNILIILLASSKVTKVNFFDLSFSSCPQQIPFFYVGFRGVWKREGRKKKKRRKSGKI